jgi:hypothetical protein
MATSSLDGECFCVEEEHTNWAEPLSWDGGGTHTGPAFEDLALGELDKPNTGKVMRFTGTTVFRLKDGMIVEEMGEEDALRVCSQLGVVGPLRWTTSS